MALAPPCFPSMCIADSGINSTDACTRSGQAFSIRVCGNHLIDAEGRSIQLRGVNVAGLEGVAILGWSPDNPWGSQTGTATPDWKAIKSWGSNAVRLPLNEASWLGLTCVDEGGVGVTIAGGEKKTDRPGAVIMADPGGNYRKTVKFAVAGASDAGLYVILDLHLNAPGNACPNAQNAMADADHSIAFWSSVASTFKGYPNSIFELFNEPFLDQAPLVDSDPWTALLNGNGTLTSYNVQGNPSVIQYRWRNAGVQQLLDAVRATGATNVVLASSLAYSSSMGGWLKYHPIDSLKPNQVAAVWHSYPATGYPAQAGCIGLPSCSERLLAEVRAILKAGYPVVITEFGDVIGKNTPPWVSKLLPFADANDISYLGWTWDVWPDQKANVLIVSGSGAPTPGYGDYVKAHYLCRASSIANCP